MKNLNHLPAWIVLVIVLIALTVLAALHVTAPPVLTYTAYALLVLAAGLTPATLPGFPQPLPTLPLAPTKPTISSPPLPSAPGQSIIDNPQAQYPPVSPQLSAVPPLQ